MAEGFVFTLLCGLLGLWTSTWYQGVMFGACGVAIFGAVWEFLTVYLAQIPFKPFNTWGDTYGDIMDWLMFVAGAVVIALPTGVFS